jgi:hypothetical protein
MTEFSRSSDSVYIHIEGEIRYDKSRKVYVIEMEGKIELSSHSERSDRLNPDLPNTPDAGQNSSGHEEFKMELRASTRFKAGQKKTLASKDGLLIELRIEEDD